MTATAPWPDSRAWIQKLRSYGLDVTVAEGWNDPKHKAGPPVRACQLYVARDGKITAVYARRTWHAGLGRAYPEWGVPANMLNRYSIGMEIESQGGGVQDLTVEQLRAATLAAAATLDLLGLDESHLINHKDYAGAAQGKVDTAYSAEYWRRRVRAAWADHKRGPRKATPYPGRPVLFGDTSNAVATVQAALGITPDGVFGPDTARRLAKWKTNHLLGRNGKVLRRTGYNRLVRFGKRRSRLS